MSAISDECETCGLLITTIKGIDRCGLKRPARANEPCVFRDRGDSWDVTLSPSELAAIDQYSAEMVAHPPIPINLVVLYKVLNRYVGLVRMRKLGMPEKFLVRQQGLIEQALDGLREWVIENDAMEDWEPRGLRGEDDDRQE